MSEKGNQTKQVILSSAHELFAKKGFKDVTMKDICMASGLSRGGLYRHYESTDQIFVTLLKQLQDSQKQVFTDGMKQGISAKLLLQEILSKYGDEIEETSQSLSLAIVEFFSSKKQEEWLKHQYLRSKQMWMEVLTYGIEKGEFHQVDKEAFCDVLLFYYQGMRMYHSLMDVEQNAGRRCMNFLAQRLYKEDM